MTLTTPKRQAQRRRKSRLQTKLAPPQSARGPRSSWMASALSGKSAAMGPGKSLRDFGCRPKLRNDLGGRLEAFGQAISFMMFRDDLRAGPGGAVTSFPLGVDRCGDHVRARGYMEHRPIWLKRASDRGFCLPRFSGPPGGPGARCLCDRHVRGDADAVRGEQGAMEQVRRGAAGGSSLRRCRAGWMSGGWGTQFNVTRSNVAAWDRDILIVFGMRFVIKRIRNMFI